MEFTVTIQSHDPAELAAVFNALAGNKVAPAPSAPVEQTKPAPAKPAAKAPPAPAPVEQPKPAPKPAAPAAVEQPAAAPAGLSYEKDVQGKILEATQNPAVGFEKVRELLASFGVARGKELKPEQLQPFLDQLAGLASAPAQAASESVL